MPLEGREMGENEYLNELRAEVYAEGFAERLANAHTLSTAQILTIAILRVGRRNFGRSPTKQQKADIAALTRITHLYRLCRRLYTATSWDDLLSTSLVDSSPFF